MIDGEVIGHLIVYVDDVLIAAPTEVIHAVMDSFRKEWECKIVGVIPKGDVVSEYTVDSLVFLSITIEPTEGGLKLHQHEYLRDKIVARRILRTRPNLPEIKEGRGEPASKEVRETSAFKQALKRVQEEVGSLQWLALKTRLDIAAIVAICASLISRNPWQAFHLDTGDLEVPGSHSVDAYGCFT